MKRSMCKSSSARGFISSLLSVARWCGYASTAILVFSYLGDSAQAQDRTNEYRLANELHITFFSPDFGCLTPAAARALAITTR
jgi:hypothetical protein